MCFGKRIQYDRTQFEIEKKRLKRYIGKDLDVVIPQGVEIICDRAFLGNLRIRSVEIPEGVTIIDGDSERYGAFQNCPMLTKVKLPSSLWMIEYHCFQGCGNLTDINLESVKYILSQAFIGCNLKTVELGKSIKRIAKDAFAPHTMFSVPDLSVWFNLTEAPENYMLSVNGQILEELRLPGGLQSIKENPFSQCSSIRKIICNPELKSIESWAFSCENLQEVVLNEGLESIGKNAFRRAKLKELYIPRTVVEIAGDAFNCKIEKLKIPSVYQSRIYSIIGTKPNEVIFYD